MIMSITVHKKESTFLKYIRITFFNPVNNVCVPKAMADELSKIQPLLYIYDDGTVEKRIVIE